MNEGRKTTAFVEDFEAFAELLGSYIQRWQGKHEDRSLQVLAITAGVDAGHISRLLRGVTNTATPRALVRLSLALKLEPEELDSLFVAAAYDSLKKTPKPHKLKEPKGELSLLRKAKQKP